MGKDDLDVHRSRCTGYLDFSKLLAGLLAPLTTSAYIGECSYFSCSYETIQKRLALVTGRKSIYKPLSTTLVGGWRSTTLLLTKQNSVRQMIQDWLTFYKGSGIFILCFSLVYNFLKGLIPDIKKADWRLLASRYNHGPFLYESPAPKTS
jgi:hypothetical protein